MVPAQANDSDFEDITSEGSGVILSSKLDIGGSFQGKLVEFQQNRKYPKNQNLVMLGDDGETFTVLTSGTLNYAIKDNKFEIGRTYRVTRLENKDVKGKSTTTFQIQRLREDGSTAAPTQNDEKPAGARNSK